MSEDSCNCGCSTKPDTDTKNAEGCNCGCAGGDQASKEDVVA